MKKKILVLNCGTHASCDFNSLLKDNAEYEVWGASTQSNHGEFVYKNYINDIPNMNEENFIEVLNEKIEKYNFKLLIATHEDLILFLQKNQQKINATVCHSCLETAELCRYKSKTYNVIKDYDFCPIVYSSKKEISKYPIFIKKDEDQGSRHAYKILNEKDFDNKYNEDMVICEYLPGEEVTCECFTNKNGKLLFLNARRTDRMLAGIDVRAVKIEVNNEIQNIAEKLNEKISFRGIWFFQIKKDANGKFKLLEISTRFPGSFSFTEALGVNLPYLVCKEFDNKSINKIIVNNLDIEMDQQFFSRFKINLKYDIVYIDIESCFNKKNVNPLLMMFIYQSVNNHKKIIGILNDNKKKIIYTKKISLDLFDEFMNMKLFMKQKEKNAILISDDLELNDWSKINQISSFEINQVNCLIDWKG